MTPPHGPRNPFIEFPRTDLKTSIPTRFEHQVALYPHKNAIQTQSGAITYSALNQQANQVAWSILDRLNGQSAPVAILLESGVDMAMAILGVSKAGCTWISLDPANPPSQLDFIIQDVQAPLVLTNIRNLSLFQQLESAPAIINLDNVFKSAPTDNPNQSIDPDFPAYILYTSGSTGQPKGVVHSHRNVLHNLMIHTNTLHINHQDRLTLLQSFNHLAGLSAMFRAFFNGATLYPYSIKENGLAPVANWLNQNAITLFHSVATVFRHFTDTLTASQTFPHLRLIHLGGEPVTSQDVARYKQFFADDCLLMNNLGCTEAGTISCYFINKDTPIDDGLVPVGYPVFDKELLILNEAGQPVAPGTMGEIAVRSHYLALEYLNRPQLTSKMFLPDPNGSRKRIYRTGDLGRLDKNGALVHLGRKDSQIKIRGQRVEITGVETALNQLAYIKESVVVGKDDGMGGKTLTACIVPHSDTTPSITEIRHALTQNLPDYMIPSSFLILESLPLLPNRKTDRRALEALVQKTGPERNHNFNAPADEMEQTLAALWEKILAIEMAGRDDNFFHLGGHSLSAVRLISQIETTFNVTLPQSAIFQAPTIAQMANLLRNRHSIAINQSSVVPIRVEGNKPPLFCIPGNLGNVYVDLHHLAQHLGDDQPLYGLQDGIGNPYHIQDLASLYLDQIQQVNPHGPYLLAGYCAGAVVAFEIAQQLRARNKHVGLLALIEPAPPRGPSLESYANFVYVIGRRLLRRFSHHADNFNRLDITQRQNYKQLKTKLIANSWGLRQYAPAPYPGQMYLFLSGDSLRNNKNPQLRWLRFAPTNTILYEVPGNHDTITGNNGTPIEESHIRVVAEHVQRHINHLVSKPQQAPVS